MKKKFYPVINNFFLIYCEVFILYAFIEKKLIKTFQ
jgi:hypothetical protein